MNEKKDPESLDELPKVDITQELKEFVNDLSQTIIEEKTNRAWWEQKIDIWRNLRYGIRNPKNHPWPNCANYMLPIIDGDISRLKPSYVNLINVTPIVTFEAYGAEDIDPARKREQLFDWRRRKDFSFFENYCLGVDYMLEQGAVIFKNTWKYSTRTYTVLIDLKDLPEQVLSAIYDPIVDDQMLTQIIIENFQIDTEFEENQKEVEKVVKRFRQGKSEFEMTLVEAEFDKSEMTPCSIRDEVVFPLNTTDLNDARFIDYRFCMSRNDVKIAMRDERYEEYSDGIIRAWAGNDQATRSNKKNTSYLSMRDDDTIWLHETCVWHDVNGDGIDERCIVTWPDNDPTSILRFIECPYDHGQWPYVLVKREINDTGVFSSRGIPALDEDFQNGISTSFNQAVDNGTIVNSPKVVYKRNSLTNIRNIRYIPGEAVETNGPTTDYEIRQQGNVSQQFLFGQAQYLKAWKDERLGSLTSGLSQINNVQGQGQQGNKTAKEINVIEAMQAEVQSLDLQIFQQQMARVYYQLDALDEQFGQDEEQIITNDKPMNISRKEIQGRFNIMPNGRLDNSNPALRANKSYTILKAFYGDPDIRQEELKKMFLQDFDAKLVGKLFKTPEEKQAEAKAMMEQQKQHEQDIINTQFGIKAQTDAMDIRKEAVLTTFQGKKYAAG